MNIEIRAMVPEDADQVAAVEEQCFAMPWSRQSFWEEASHTEAYYLLATDSEQGGMIVAYAPCLPLSQEAGTVCAPVRCECRSSLPGILIQGDQPTFRSANMISN